MALASRGELRLRRRLRGICCADCLSFWVARCCLVISSNQEPETRTEASAATAEQQRVKSLHRFVRRFPQASRAAWLTRFRVALRWRREACPAFIHRVFASWPSLPRPGAPGPPLNARKKEKDGKRGESQASRASPSKRQNPVATGSLRKPGTPRGVVMPPTLLIVRIARTKSG